MKFLFGFPQFRPKIRKIFLSRLEIVLFFRILDLKFAIFLTLTGVNSIVSAIA